MNARDFQQLASELVGGTSPAHFRTAITRAYYATYNVGVELLEGMGFRISRGSGGHGEVRMHLNNSGEGDISRVATQLGDLHGRRIHADYELGRTDVESQTTARALVQQARRMIQALDGCCAEPKRTRIIAAITVWKGKVSAGGP